MNNEIITLDMYFQDYITKKDRRIQYASEYNKDILANATKLLKLVNAFLIELGIDRAAVTSGWRPSEINSATPNAAKRSLHMNGLAVDILDNKDQDLAKLVTSKPELLKKYDLWVEDFSFTKGRNTNWNHIDCGIRSERPSRVFKP